MKAKLFSLVLCFGLTFGRNIQESEPTPSGDTWNPLAELLGLKVADPDDHRSDELFDMFEKHTKEMDEAMEQHQKMMDSAMVGHHQLLDSAFGDLRPELNAQHKSAMAQHQGLMDRQMNDHMKDMTQSNKDWEELDKEMSQMFKSFNKHMDQSSDPFEKFEILEPIKMEKPIIRTDERLTNTWIKKPGQMAGQMPGQMAEQRAGQMAKPEKIIRNETVKTGLPIFHPKQTTDPTVPELQPVHKELEYASGTPSPVEVQDNGHEKNLQAQPYKTVMVPLIEDEADEHGHNSTDKDLFSKFVGDVVYTAAQLGSLIVDGLTTDDNQTLSDDSFPGIIAMVQNIGADETELDKKLKIAYVLNAMDNVLMGRITRFTLTDYEDDLKNLENEGFMEQDLRMAEQRIIEMLHDHHIETPIGLMWTKNPLELSRIESGHYSKLEILDEAIDSVSNKIVTLIKQQAQMDDNMKRHLSDEKYIANQLKREFIIRRVDDDDLEWYEWTAIGLVIITSSLLLIVALFMCAQRQQRVRAVRLAEKVAELKDGPNVNSVSNENLSNKCKEKIKTIYVNLK